MISFLVTSMVVRCKSLPRVAESGLAVTNPAKVLAFTSTDKNPSSHSLSATLFSLVHTVYRQTNSPAPS